MGTRHSHQNYDVFGEMSYVSVRPGFLQSSPQSPLPPQICAEDLGSFQALSLDFEVIAVKVQVPKKKGPPDLLFFRHLFNFLGMSSES